MEIRIHSITTACLGLALVAAHPPAAPPQGLYLGQKQPGRSAELFAPGIVSTFMNDRDIAISPDGKEIFFGNLQRPFTLLHMRQKADGTWTEPEVAPFSGRYGDCEPAFAPDGKRLYYCSTRPLDGKGPAKDFDIWFVERTDKGWSEPRNPGAPLNTAKNEFYPSIARDGTVYYTSYDMKLWRARREGEGFAAPECLPESINGRGGVYNAFVAPDESLLVFTSHLGEPRGDLVVSFRKPAGEWARPVNLGSAVNSRGTEMSPFLSVDGKVLFFSSDRPGREEIPAGPRTFADIRKEALAPGNGQFDIYWVDAGILEDLRPKGE